MGLTFNLGRDSAALTSDASLNVGIGGSPSGSYKLEVTGTAKVSSTLLMGTGSQVMGAGLLKLGISSGNAGAGLQLLGWSGSYRNWQIDTAYINAAFNITPSTTNGGSTFTTPAFTITTDSNVGIGTASPTQLLDVNGTSRMGQLLINQASTAADIILKFQINGTNKWLVGLTNDVVDDNFSIYQDGSGGGKRFDITTGGDVGIGRVSNNGRLEVQGSSTASGNYTFLAYDSSTNTLLAVRNDGLINTGLAAGSPYNNTTANAVNMRVDGGGVLLRSTASSQRFKEEIKDWNASGLDIVLALKPKTFKYKKDYYDKADVDFLGLIAEEVAEVSTYLADYENEDRTGQVENVRYANIVVPLIAAIQELNERLNKAGL